MLSESRITATVGGILLLLLHNVASDFSLMDLDVKETSNITKESHVHETNEKSDGGNKCPNGFFECKGNNLLCIPQSANCNGKPECPDGSDEDRCKDPHSEGLWNILWKKRADEDSEKQTGTCNYEFQERENFGNDKSLEYTLAKDKNLVKFSGTLSTERNWAHSGDSEKDEQSDFPKKVSLSRFVHSTIQTMQLPTMDWETEGCSCVAEKLFCHNLELQNLNFLPWNLQYLDLSGSRVENMDFTPPVLIELDTLILSGCFIEDIEPGAFVHLTSLRVLYLTNNRLRYLPNELFGGHSADSGIRKLFLDYNQITLIQPKSFEGLSSITELDLRHNLLSGLELGVFQSLRSLKVLNLANNKIEFVRKGFLEGLYNLVTLTLSNNEITHVEPGSFDMLSQLEQLYLNWNKISVLHERTFCNLRRLLTLNLRGNEIINLEPFAFSCLVSLKSLNLEQNRFGEVPGAERIFSNLTSLSHIYFDQFWMCAWAYHVRSCEPKGDGISSAKNLLDSVVLRVSVWIMGFLSLFGNLFVIFCRIVVREPNKIHSFYIRNLAASDLLMGLFLITIAVHDVSYRGQFLAYQFAWRHSWTCQISGLLSTWSSESSVLILTLITLDRYISIVQPFAEKTASLNVALGICTFLWVTSFLLSYAPISGLFRGYFGSSFYTGNGLCLPLHIHNPYDPAWEYSFILFVLLNSMAFIFICFAYIRMLRVIRRSTLMIRSTQQKQDSLLAKRFAVVVLTDFLCWAPIVAAKVLAMTGVSIPTDLYAWLAVFALPVNSALNPIIYTLTTKLFKQQISKYSRSVRSRIFRTHHMDDSGGSLSLFRYRTPRTGNTSLAQSIRRTNKERKSVCNSSIVTHHIPLKIVVPSQVTQTPGILSGGSNFSRLHPSENDELDVVGDADIVNQNEEIVDSV